MQVNPQSWMDDLRLATAFATRIPTPLPAAEERRNMARCLRVLPLVGAVIGAVTGLLYVTLAGLGVPPLAAAAAALAACAFTTGALHEDGLADVADGMGGYTRARRLEIMRDSRVGTFGALALVFSALIKATCLAALPGWLAVCALAASEALARAPMAALSRWTPNARADGLASAAGRPDAAVAITGVLLGTALAVLLLPGEWLAAALLVTALATFAVRALAMRLLGGHTGDVLGCAMQVSQACLLMLFAALAGGVA